MKATYFIIGIAFSHVATCGCPFADLAKRSGGLTEDDRAKLEQVRRDPSQAEALFKAHQAKKRAPTPQPQGGIIGPILGGVLDLPLGGGLRKLPAFVGVRSIIDIHGPVNGVLQPLTGALAAIDLPTPQPQGLQEIPGDDPDHQFQAPGPTDIRGVCPTLNALANHGYISRDGITSFAQAANAVQTGYGFDFSLSVFLSAVGLMAGGDLATGKYTIAGRDARVPDTLGPAGGLDKHGVFEIDGSVTRQDVHFGNNANFLEQRWDEYVAEANEHDGEFGFDTQAQDNGLRYDNSIKTNPDFFAGAIWFIVSHAERVFVYAGLANGTTGKADYDNVAPFFLNETFPANWYRRGVPFTLPQAIQQAGAMFLANPRALGGNQGVGNFVPIDIASDPSNIANAPAELGCFVLENLLDVAPNQLDPLIYDNFELFTGFIKGVIAPFFINDGYFNCPAALEFTKPGENAGESGGSVSSSGSPVDGAYPGIGIIAPDSQPS
ncbi:uncharacterized protein KY384_008984 [Bacidia gigantensis]|uniref:uncharacterized protein n=1 Tax=Bacidia gigantensis TaxID=2732470 RepID=UPI001D05BF6C|nr:uncharacterized protein KY384_008984 [Bacidia gigantensis]KAG8525340.1 hypothetical protein KY384_008984 [Bacidia gigantensis]